MKNQPETPEALAHALFTAAQLAPGEGIEDAVGRLAALVEAQQHARIAELEAQLEAIGAGGVSGPLMGCADSKEREAFESWIKKDCGDLSTFGSGVHQHYRNSAVNNAWAGWKARATLDPSGFTAADMATASAQGFRDGVASVSAGSETVASYAIRLLVAAALITQAKADEALRLAAEISAAPGPADGESNELC